MMIKFSSLVAATLIVALGGCASSAVLPTTIGWRTAILVENPPLPTVSVLLPRGFTVASGHGIDSAVAQIIGPGLIINADYGRSGPQFCGSIGGCRQSSALVDGRPAAWVRYPKNGVIGSHTYSHRLDFGVKLWPSQDPTLGPTAGLLLTAACTTTSDCDLAQEIARSVRFDRPPR